MEYQTTWPASWEIWGPTSPSSRKTVLNIHWKDRYRGWNSNTLATWYEEITHLKRPWCWERLKAGREKDDRGWDGWMASPTSMDMGLSKLWELVIDWESWHTTVHRVAKSWTQLTAWAERNWWSSGKDCALSMQGTRFDTQSGN